MQIFHSEDNDNGLIFRLMSRSEMKAEKSRKAAVKIT